MADHYYTAKPNTESNPQSFNYQLRGQNFRFTTDRGVFSKSEVDFGSRLLIESFTEPDTSGPFLDVGCGYGPIGLSLAKTFPERTVHMVDVNERALNLSIENAKHNQISNVKIYQSNSFDEVEKVEFSSIVTNPPIRAGKKVVFDIMEKSNEYLKTEGELWVVIQKKQGAPSLKKKLEELFGNVETITKDKGYYIFKSKKI